MANRTIGILAAGLIGASLISLAEAQKIGGELSPELNVLDRFVGEWEETAVQRTPPLPPASSTMKAIGTRKWILNGHMIENKGVWLPSERDFLHLTTYDANQGEYRQYYFDKNSLGGDNEYRGRWDEATKTLTFKGESKKGVHSTLTHRFIDDDTFTWTLVAKDRAGKVVIDVEGKAVRVKK